MKVTLVYPGIGLNGFNSFKRIPTCDANYIYHGLASLSAAAKREGHEVDLIDLRALKSWEHFAAVFKLKNPPVVGISFLSIDYEPAMTAIEVMKRLNPSTTIVAGGVHCTVATQDVLLNPHIDYIITGEGEISFPRLLGALERGEAPPRLICGERPNLDEIPWVDRDLFDCSGELALPFVPDLEPPFVTTNAGRGCPFRCTFCQPAERMVFQGKVRMRSPENVVGELQYLRERFQFKSLMFHDDLFPLNPKWVFKFCDLYEREGFRQKFICQVRADIVCRNPQMMQRLAEVGLAWAMIGFESGSQRLLDLMKKDTTVEENLEAAEICRRYGIKIFANYMFGLPTETKQEVMQTVAMIRKIDPDWHSPSFFTPHSHTELYDYCVEHNLLLADPHRVDRSPRGAKIKGVDYKLLRGVVLELTSPRATATQKMAYALKKALPEAAVDSLRRLKWRLLGAKAF